MTSTNSAKRVDWWLIGFKITIPFQVAAAFIVMAACAFAEWSAPVLRRLADYVQPSH